MKASELGLGRGDRETLPSRRRTTTQKLTVKDRAGVETKVYVSFGYFSDGRLGEIFLDVSKQNTVVRGMMDVIAMLASAAFQHGTSAETVVNSLIDTNFPPSGEVFVDVVTNEGPDFEEVCRKEHHPTVKACRSLTDLIGRLILAEIEEDEDDG